MRREKRARERQIKPEGTTVQLEPLEYFELRTRLRDVEAAQVQAQRLVAEAVERQNALYRTLAEKYVLPVNPQHVQWNDATKEISVKGAQ